MEALLTFSIAFFFSFIGSIPPGTVNLQMIQLGLERRMDIAWRFAIAAAIMEYPYAWLAIEFQNLITTSTFITNNFKLLAAIVMIVLGILNLWSTQKPGAFAKKFNESGFRRGLVLSILNPMLLPFWIGMTAYLKSVNWIRLSSTAQVQSYLLGVTLGSLCILILLAYLAKKLVSEFSTHPFLKKIPGVTMLILGFYALIKYLL
jgi:threonine/homoserine/homoserine lactone efflux protein